MTETIETIQTPPPEADLAFRPRRRFYTSDILAPLTAEEMATMGKERKRQHRADLEAFAEAAMTDALKALHQAHSLQAIVGPQGVAARVLRAATADFVGCAQPGDYEER